MFNAARTERFHPLIASMYLKKTYGNGESVVVIETNAGFDEKNDNEKNEYLMELLADLDHLQAQAKRKFGTFDRIDIRTH